MLFTALFVLSCLLCGVALIHYGVQAWKSWGWDRGLVLAPFVLAAAMIGLGLAPIINLVR